MNFGITYNNSLSYNNIRKTDGLDYSEIKAVSKELLSKNNKTETVLNQSNLEKFATRQTVGIDLYSGNITPEVARNIAIQNSGHNVSLTENGKNSIQYLNTQAARYTNNLSTIMDGKIHIATNAEIGFVQQPQIQQSTVRTVTSTPKDSQGGNPFSAGTGNTSMQKH